MSEQVASESAVSRKASRPPEKRESLYADWVKVHPKAVKGPIRRIKWIALVVFLAIYYLVPWLRWDRGPGAPDQAMLLSMDEGRAYILGLEIWAQEIYYLTGLLVLAALGLFFVTSLFGRIWCGYACPQTVWTDLFLAVERFVEGDRNARIRLDQAPLSLAKLAKRGVKHGIWIVIAVLTGGAWVFYFWDAPTIARELLTGDAGTGLYALIFLFTATTYLLAGWAREQVCTYMCPWPRFQSAMFDEDTLIVTYERWRGEPRGSHKAGAGWEGRGDCVDCNQCVAVCPTGIDIRDGSQLECIGCGLCIDACNAVMAKVGRPANLITFDTQRAQDAIAKGRERPRFQLVRLRTAVYLAIMAFVGIAMLIGLATRSPVEMNALHERNPLFVTLSDGSIRNAYTLRVLNKRLEERELVLALEGLPGAVLTLPGHPARPDGRVALRAKPDEVMTLQAFVKAPRDIVRESQEIRLVLRGEKGQVEAERAAPFKGPPGGPSR
ncbi:MAG: cytochrome c oxidase accessory protein CcoG [Alphaproteobacteria bacterium]|nr:cytochrome c oxidase accessory protein CcoG [Alphaproteobacteria bacterium]